MRFFLDTEFIEDGKTIDLISIGIVNEEGKAFYAISAEADYNKAWNNEWVRINVLKQLPHDIVKTGLGPENYLWVLRTKDPNVWSRAEIADNILNYIADAVAGPDDPIEFWAYYADYDWVVLCQLFGTMMDLPKGFPMFCMDIKQLAVMLGNPTLPPQGKGEHNALADARWNAEAFKFLRGHFHADDYVGF